MSSKRFQRGFTLVEILVALLIGLFLAAGLIMVTQGTKATYNNQSALAQMQDNQRFAMSVLNDVIQAAGYYPDPTFNTATTDMPVLAAFPQFTTAGQPVYGTHTAGTPDSISVQFNVATGDTTLNCAGQQNSAPQRVFYSQFTVVPNATNPLLGQLTCSVGFGNPATGWQTPVVLVTGVTNLLIYYGINSTGATVTHDVDTYKTANQMSAADWMNVSSVQVQLTFANPLYGTLPGQSTAAAVPQTVTLTRVISVMSRVGVTT